MQGTILSNRYLIADEIGVGGMGNVYRAVDLRTGGEVAVKIPHAFLARNPEYVERLRREAQIAASVYSPRVVRVMDLDTHDGLPYLVMEYVPGETLADVQRQRGRFSLLDTLTAGLEVARALDAAHTKNIVHRDLKPQNIKLVEGEVKVLDFGIAKAEGFANVTAASIFMGTPEYCAPERADGLGDIRSDIYSLGVILYEMHEGHLPFQAATPMALMRKHETEPPPPLTGDVPPHIQEILGRCLAKSPADRYQTPRELVQALRGALDGPPSEVTPTLRPEPLAPTVRQARDGDSEPEAQALAATLLAGAPDVRATTPAPVGAPAAPAATATAPSTHTRSRVPILAIGGVAAVIALVLVAVLALTNRGGDAEPLASPTADTSVPSATVEIAASPAVPPTAVVARTPPAPAALLAPGQRRELNGVAPVDLPLPPPCAGAKVVLQLTAISVSQTGRVTVAYAVSAPRVSGLDCSVAYPSDANCRCMLLETRRASGPAIATRNTGGAGVSTQGAEEIYGTPPVIGEWFFDGVELEGEELVLAREFVGTDIVQFRVALLRR